VALDHDGEVIKDFIASVGLSTAEAERLLIEWGPNELAEKKKAKVSDCDSNLLYHVS